MRCLACDGRMSPEDMVRKRKGDGESEDLCETCLIKSGVDYEDKTEDFTGESGERHGLSKMSFKW